METFDDLPERARLQTRREIVQHLQIRNMRDTTHTTIRTTNEEEAIIQENRIQAHGAAAYSAHQDDRHFYPRDADSHALMSDMRGIQRQLTEVVARGDRSDRLMKNLMLGFVAALEQLEHKISAWRADGRSLRAEPQAWETGLKEELAAMNVRLGRIELDSAACRADGRSHRAEPQACETGLKEDMAAMNARLRRIELDSATWRAEQRSHQAEAQARNAACEENMAAMNARLRRIELDSAAWRAEQRSHQAEAQARDAACEENMAAIIARLERNESNSAAWRDMQRSHQTEVHATNKEWVEALVDLVEYIQDRMADGSADSRCSSPMDDESLERLARSRMFSSPTTTDTTMTPRQEPVGGEHLGKGLGLDPDDPQVQGGRRASAPSTLGTNTVPEPAEKPKQSADPGWSSGVDVATQTVSCAQEPRPGSEHCSDRDRLKEHAGSQSPSKAGGTSSQQRQESPTGREGPSVLVDPEEDGRIPYVTPQDKASSTTSDALADQLLEQNSLNLLQRTDAAFNSYEVQESSSTNPDVLVDAVNPNGDRRAPAPIPQDAASSTTSDALAYLPAHVPQDAASSTTSDALADQLLEQNGLGLLRRTNAAFNSYEVQESSSGNPDVPVDAVNPDGDRRVPAPIPWDAASSTTSDGLADDLLQEGGLSLLQRTEAAFNDYGLQMQRVLGMGPIPFQWRKPIRTV